MVMMRMGTVAPLTQIKSKCTRFKTATDPKKVSFFNPVSVDDHRALIDKITLSN